MAPTRHQQIPEGEAFVEPRNVETVRGLLAAAEKLNLDPSVVRTQSGGYLAPAAVVEAFLADSPEGVDVTEHDDSVDEFGFAKVDTEEAGSDSESTGSDTEGTEGDTGSEPVTEIEQPAKSAAKPEWVAFAVAKSAGTDEPLTEEQANALTTAQLIERFGASE